MILVCKLEIEKGGKVFCSKSSACDIFSGNMFEELKLGYVLGYGRRSSPLKKGAKYVHPTGTQGAFWTGPKTGNLAIFQKFGRMCRLGAHTVEMFGAPKDLTPPWIHAKYEPLTPLSS